MSHKEKVAELDQAYNITITARHMQITQAMKDYALDKISKIEKLTPRLIDVYVIMDIQRINNRVDMLLKMGNIKLKSHGISTDMYVSIDFAVDKMEKQIQKYKSRLQEHQTRGVPSIDMLVNVYRAHSKDELEDINSDIEEETERLMLDKYRPHDIVAQEKMDLKTLNHEQAILHLEISGDPFLVFRDEGENKLQVIYRRPDGDYGIISPDY